MRIPLLLVCTCLTFCAVSAEAALPTLSDPTFTPAAAVNGAITLGINVDPGGQLTEVTLKYGLDDKLDTKAAVQTIPGDATNRVVSFPPLTGLVGGKTYHFKITARNASSGDVGVELPGTFKSGSYPPTAVALPATGIKGGEVTLNGTVTSNQSFPTIVTAFFRFQTTPGVPVTAEPLPGDSDPIAIAASAVKKPISHPLTEQDREKPLYYKVLVLHEGKVFSSSEQTVALTNRLPVAVEDIVTIDGRGPVVIDVLANDRDRDGDKLNLKSTTKPQHGTVTLAGNELTLTYTPDSSFIGTDEFTYVVEDGRGRATGTVKIQSPRTAVAGLRGGLITDANGDSVGLLRIRTGASGAFTGKVQLNGKSYTLIGTLDVNGHFKGTAHGDDGSISVEFSVDQVSGATLLGSLDGDRYQLSLQGNQTSQIPISDLEGRYTVELPGGSGTSSPSSEEQATPGGVGWAIVEISGDGYAEIKGKLADGSGFSTTSVVSQGATGATLPFYATADQSIVVGTLEIGVTITGTIEWKGEAADSGSQLETTITAGGSRYSTPIDGRRALETGDAEMSEMSLNLSGGNVPTDLSILLRVSEGDDVQVLGDNFQEVEMEIDRKTGRFNGGFTHLNDGNRRKFSGVLNQANGGGKGLFPGLDQTGTVELSVTSTDPATPNPEPQPPTPGPVDPIPTQPDPLSPGIVNSRR